jgi:hypothetical protein
VEGANVNWSPQNMTATGRIVFCGGTAPSNCPALRVLDRDGHVVPEDAPLPDDPRIGLSLAGDEGPATELVMPPHEIVQLVDAYEKGLTPQLMAAIGIDMVRLERGDYNGT